MLRLIGQRKQLLDIFKKERYRQTLIHMIVTQIALELRQIQRAPGAEAIITAAEGQESFRRLTEGQSFIKILYI